MRCSLGVAGLGAVALIAFGCGSTKSGSSGTGGTGTGIGGAGGGIILPTAGTDAGSADQCPAFVGLENCGTTKSQASLKKVNTLLVVDKSGSMSDQPAGYAQNKWISLTQALGTVLTNTQKLMAYGLELFPAKAVASTCGADCCNMAAPGTIDVPIPGAVADITGLLNQTVPGGGTPTAAALRSALQYFQGAGGALQGQKIVFLATDGGPNCNAAIPGGCPVSACTNNIDGKPAPTCVGTTLNCCDPANSGSISGCLDTADVVTAIGNLRNAGIYTVVLGLPGSDKPQYITALDQIAQAGGLPNPSSPPYYYSVNASAGVQGLTDTINQITTQFINKCDIQLDQEVQDPAKVDVALDCNVLRRPGSDGGGGDWYLNMSTSPPTVTLQGDVCNRVRTQGAQRIDVILGCAGTVT
jgi:hypothetical protein